MNHRYRVRETLRDLNPMTPIVLILLLLLGGLQFKLWNGQGGLVEWSALRAQRHNQILENRRLKERNSSLEAEVADLKDGLEAIEERARSEMGMIKTDEVFYQIIDTGPRKSIDPIR
ncbi:cell division protein FtsB [soil metagenome]